MIRKPPFWATLFTLLGIGVLCSLGVWQLQRLSWKQEIIERLNAAYDTVHSERQAPEIDFGTMQESDFRYGRAQGIFMADKALLLGPKTRDGKIGYDLIVPLATKQGTLLVNLGWTTEKGLDYIRYHDGRAMSFAGLARRMHWNAFTPANKPQENLWYKPDITEIAKAKNLENPLPFFLFAEESHTKFDAPFPNNERWQPNNNHLQYAIFWFTMAGALIVVYILRFLRKN
jgi:surfeit locus 1 family protein